MGKFKNRINKIKKLELLVKRLVYPIFHKTHPLFRKKDYFLKLFQEKTLEYNIEALNFKEGIVSGTFQGKDYLMNCRPGNFIESTIYLEKVWEEHLAKIMSLYLNGVSGIAIDVGGNIGANSIPLAIKYPQVKFYCYEPHPDIFVRLKNNIKLNKLVNVKPNNCAVSNVKEKTIKFFAQKNSDNMGRSSLKLNSDIKDHEEITVPTIRIDDVFADSSVPILLIKIDTQGTEFQVLESGASTIEKFRPPIFFELEDRYFPDEERIATKKALKEFFDSLDYSLFSISRDLNYYPKIDITQNYHGDIFAIPV